MADFTVTVSNSLRVFQEATLWGDAVWGTSFWGYGSETAKLDATKFVDGEVSFSDSLLLSIGFNVTISNSLSSEFELTDQRLTESSGYSYVFTGPTTDADGRNTATFSEVTGGNVTWTPTSATTTTWSES